MAAKTVALDRESYDLLAQQKRAGETFSDTVRRLAGKKGSILDFWGMWSEIPERDLRTLRKLRSLGKKRDAERLARVVDAR
jgi:predicted CopG family antitoxin